MRKGRSISITHVNHLIKERRVSPRDYFKYGTAVWNGARWTAVTPMTQTQKEYEMFKDEPECWTVTLEFLPAVRNAPAGTVSFEAEKRKAALMKNLEDEERYRAHLRRVSSMDG